MQKEQIEAVFPLSPQQRGMLYESLASGDSGVHVEQASCSLPDDFDVSAFAGAWQRLLARHSILRTAFAWKSRAEPLQVVLRSVPVPLRRLAWRDRGLEQGALQTLRQDELQRGFDLARAPLMRLTLVESGAGSQLIWTHHHILMDGWCRGALLRELFDLYEALRRGEEPVLDPARPYLDYVQWLQEKQRDLSNAEDFWRHRLQGISRATPIGRPPLTADPSAYAVGFGERRGSLDGAGTARLQALTRRYSLTPNTLIQGAWALLLRRYAGTRDVTFGATVAGRPSELPQVESILGLFINTLPFRVSVRPEASLANWLAQDIQRGLLELRDYEYCSAGQIHRWSEVPGCEPLFHSVLVFENRPTPASPKNGGGRWGAGGGLQDAHFAGARTRHPLSVLVTLGSELEVLLVYNRQNLTGEDAAVMLEQFLGLLDLFGEGLDRFVSEVEKSLSQDLVPRFRPPLQARGEDGFTPPRTATERRIADLWQEVLGLESVGIDEDFFHLNGHSLLAMTLVHRLQTDFAVELVPRDLFEAPTVAELALRIAEKQATGLEQETVERLLSQVEQEPSSR